MVTQSTQTKDWVFLLHRLPREPSAPRITLWRTLRRLGAVLVGDGVVALPHSPRTVEHLEWLAAGIIENGGEGSVWTARPTTRRTGERLARQAREAVEAEYRELMREANDVAKSGDAGEVKRTQRRLRRQLHAIGSRDFFGVGLADRARVAVDSLTEMEVIA